MRLLAARNSSKSSEVKLVNMRGKYDCLTCITAMTLGIDYEEVERTFGGNLDPDADRNEESMRLQNAQALLFERHNRGQLHLSSLPPLREGRRYWVGVRIHDPSNPHSNTMTHSIVLDEFGRVFDPNPEYGFFPSLPKWRQAMSLEHELEFAVEVFEYSL
jgi:hypothetical protein